jgi:ABC-type Fe3+/spermidine/putrescine transport system ATPase subunit
MSKTDPAPGLIVSKVHKTYSGTQVLQDVSLSVPRGEFHTLLGPSGSGKTTLLKIIAGFTPADTGSVTLSGSVITNTLPEHRNIGVVFQHYALFPHMTVSQNIAFGLRMRHVPKLERQHRVEDVLALVRMSGFGHRRPAALSGGQQQRVALARALVIQPQLLLLDEPLSALDRKVRQEVREELKRIQAETGVTTVMVTHDQEEALFLADRVLVLESGALRQEGAPYDIYRNPIDEFVAGFLGPINLLDVESRAGSGGVLLRLGAQDFVPTVELATAVAEAKVSGPMHLAIRPEQLTVQAAQGTIKPPNALNGTVTEIEFGGAVVTVRVLVEGKALAILALSPDILATASWDRGSPVWVRIRQARVLAAVKPQ